MQPPYVNRTHLQGRITSAPRVMSLNSKTKVTSFELSMVESWLNTDGERRERKNRVTVEVVGKDSERVSKEAHLGSWICLEGYIRSENFRGQVLTKVRTLEVTVWED